jgi:hypothetical protein
VSTNRFFTGQDHPRIRSNPGLFTCPFCRASNLLISNNDVADDDLGIKLCCLNPACEVSTFQITATQTGTSVLHADAETLLDLDDEMTQWRLPIDLGLMSPDHVEFWRQLIPAS